MCIPQYLNTIDTIATSGYSQGHKRCLFFKEPFPSRTTSFLLFKNLFPPQKFLEKQKGFSDVIGSL